jgi:hypothetical protein
MFEGLAAEGDRDAGELVGQYVVGVQDVVVASATAKTSGNES